MKFNSRRVLALSLALVFVLGLLPAKAAQRVTAASGLSDGTVIYYEDFNYPDNATKSSVLSTLGWKTATTLRSNQTNYSIVGGRLYCDSISSSATGDSYVTVLDDAAMSEVAKGDYTITYKLSYAAAANYTRYGCLIYNYNGYKSYNSVHLRIAGYGNNQVRSAAKWYDYDGTSGSYYMKATGTSSISYKLFGVQSLSANASTNTGYPFVNKELTVRIAVDIDAGPTVYVNGTKVSVPTGSYNDMFTASAEYAKAIALKTTKEVQLYVDDIMVYTGLGAIPSGVTKESVTYQRPVSTADKYAIKVMSFNTLYSDQSADVFGNGITRTYHMYNVVAGLHPDIVGMQERAAANMSGVTSLLESDADYTVVNEYRTDTSVSSVVSYVPILYNTKRFTLVENSAANNNVAHGALLFDKSYNIKDMTATQIASYAGTKGLAWAVLKDKKTGSYVLAMNAHFALNHSNYTGYSDEEAIEARLSNAAQAIEKMQAVYDVYGVIPTVFTGDFNMRYIDPAYKLLSESFESSIYASDDFIKYEYSMNKITGADFTRAPNAPIDHIFYNDEALVPTDYYIGNKAAELMIASDHLPVMTTFSYKNVYSPTPSHITGVYTTTQFVTLKGEGEIYYTTDNTDPRSSATRKLYGEAISVSEDTIIKSTCKVDGVYSDINRITLFFGAPLFITEVIKNAPGTDHTEGIEIINVSNVDVDLSDFTVWCYNDADEAACLAVADASVEMQMPMAYKQGDAVLPCGAVAYCPIVMGDTYLSKDAISSTESAYLVTLNEDGTKVTYHKDRYAKAISYNGTGSISESLIFPIDRTARSIGYTDSGVAVRRLDYYHATDGEANNVTKSFGLANSNYSRLYITMATDQSVANAICVTNLDSTDSGITTTDGTTSVAAGAFNFTPTDSKLMTTQSFTKGAYTIGSLTAEQKTAFDAYISARRKENGTAIRTAEEFAAMSASGNYYLAADISISASYADVFTGTLDGRGYTVTTSVPMFADMSGTVKNLTVKGDINVASGYNAAVSALVTGTARFENITVNANLSGGTTTGGVMGYGDGGAYITIIRCINNGSVSGTSQTGGIVGYVQGTRLSVDECINNGKVYSTSYSAGIVGRFGKNAATMSYKCNITNCLNRGEVSAAGTRSAGILGYSIGYVTISGCINKGYIHYEGAAAEFNASGIYGEGGATYTSGTTTTNTKNSLVIRDCYNYGTVEATCSAGGIVGKTSTIAPVSGYNYIIESCGNAGDISCADGGASRNTKGAGGIVGYFYGAANNVLSRCYNVGNISVTANADGSTVRACGIASYFNGTAMYFEDCYNAGTISASGTGSVKYQLYYNNNATGAVSDYINNNHALEVSGATYEYNGTQASSVTTFTSAELEDGTLKARINSGAGKTYYFQTVGIEAYPVLREYKGFTLWDVILKDESAYSDNATQVYKVDTLTGVSSFVSEFVSDVKVYNGNNMAHINEYIGTGYTVSSFDGEIKKAIAVTGDLDGNGVLSATDYVAIKQYLKSQASFSDIQCVAADLDESGSIGTIDYLAMRQRLNG